MAYTKSNTSYGIYFTDFKKWVSSPSSLIVRNLYTSMYETLLGLDSLSLLIILEEDNLSLYAYAV